jgi:hypothetical protein
MSRPASTYVPSIRGDAMLLTHGREDRLLIGAADLLDAILDGTDPDLAGPPSAWLARTAAVAHARTAAELITAGVATPLEHRSLRGLTLSIDARAEAAARTRLRAATGPHATALAAALYRRGLLHALTGNPFPPATHTLPATARSILIALADSGATRELAAA